MFEKYFESLVNYLIFILNTLYYQFKPSLNLQKKKLKENLNDLYEPEETGNK
jgi:hypothetical protein